MISLGNSQWLSSCTGMEVHILPDGTISSRICEISLQKNALSIDAKYEVTGDIAKSLKKVPQNKPLSITLSGKGVLTKKTNREENLNSDKFLRFFPGIKPEQFYVQNFISGNFSYISIVRQDVLDNILAAFKKSGIEVLLINLGPFALSHIVKQINFYGNEARFNGHIVNLSDSGDWEDYNYSPSVKSKFTLRIDIEPIAEQYIIAYAAAFQLLLYHKLNPVVVSVDTVQNNLNDFEQKKKFNFRLGAILGIFFILLLLNFLLFSHYSSENNVLLAQVSQNSASVESVQQIEKDITDKEKLLKELGWYKGISHGWLADQLVQSIPSGISLNEIAINPLNATESNRQRGKIYKTGTIEITGESKSLEPVNEWIYALKNKSWLKSITLDSFSPSTENDTQHFAITIDF